MHTPVSVSHPFWLTLVMASHVRHILLASQASKTVTYVYFKGKEFTARRGFYTQINWGTNQSYTLKQSYSNTLSVGCKCHSFHYLSNHLPATHGEVCENLEHRLLLCYIHRWYIGIWKNNSRYFCQKKRTHYISGRFNASCMLGQHTHTHMRVHAYTPRNTHTLTSHTYTGHAAVGRWLCTGSVPDQ